MATLINNAGVQHYANKMVLAENRKVGSKSLPTALNDIDLALDEMKNLFDAEYGSALDMKLENTENIFSVGTGSGVDKKADVENSFTDVEIKGTTLVNIYGKGFSDIANISNGAGEIVDDGYYKLVANGSYRNAFLKKGKFPMKPSTVYTVVMFVRKETLVGSKQFILSDGASDSPFKDSRIDLNGIGTYTKKVTTLSDFDSTKCGFRGYIPPQTTSGELEFKVMLLEGDWTNKPLPEYFEGLKSVGEVEGNEIEVLSRNKNEVKLTELTYNLVDNNFKNYNANLFIGSKTFSYRYDYEIISIDTERDSFYTNLAGSNINSPNQLNTDFDITLINQRLYNGAKGTVVVNNISNNMFHTLMDIRCIRTLTPVTMTYKITNFALYFSDNADTYIPYMENKKEISLNEPLRGLSNGTKDTIEKINGEWKIVRRCGEVILNGTESWSEYGSQELENSRYYYYNFGGVKSSSIICNILPVNSPDADGMWSNDIEGIAYKLGNKCFRIRLSKLKASTLNEFKQWLTQNPVKLIYELETPIIEDIEPLTLQCWKNGTISIDEVLPVESTHTVALNKPAQIKRNIEELTQLRNKVKSLEDQYDQIALEQAHQLELINHSFELDYI